MGLFKRIWEPIISPILRKTAQMKEAFRDPGCRGCLKERDRISYFCKQCQRHLDMRPSGEWVSQDGYLLDAVCNWSPWVKSLVYGYKFYGRQENQRLLVDLLTERAKQIVSEQAVRGAETTLIWIVPIPAHVQDRTHAQKLAKALSYRLEGGCYQSILQWKRVAKEQHHLGSAAARRHNMRGAFGLRSDDTAQPDLILVVDDLITTGTTMKEAMGTIHEQYDCPIVGLSVMNIAYEGKRSRVVDDTAKTMSDVDGGESNLAGLLFDDEAPEWVLPKLS